VDELSAQWIADLGGGRRADGLLDAEPGRCGRECVARTPVVCPRSHPLSEEHDETDMPASAAALQHVVAQLLVGVRERAGVCRAGSGRSYWRFFFGLAW
jgi:hypothetical protein